MIFTADDVKARLQTRPFAPLRILTTNGHTYDVYHPDLIFVTRRYIEIGTPSTDNPTLPDLVTRVPYVHVTELRDLPVLTPPPSNGSVA